jgi:dihydrofolate synthase/folylpolyglutamate synthase
LNYADALAWLYSAQQHGIKLGLDNTNALLAALDVDSAAQRFIHVAGTNGKGSVCAILDAICRAGGLSCGLYTSPHLVNFRERIRLDGGMISETDVANGLTRIRDSVPDRVAPTFFEITTVLALDYFARHQPQIVILETGLGGRLDATNVIRPLVSVLTPIDIDHSAWLGNSLEQIAREKAGIIKPDVQVVSAKQHPEVEMVLRDVASRMGAPLTIYTAPLPYPVGLKGSHQNVNAALAVAALRKTDLGISESAIEEGLKTVSWPGRFQHLGERFILDGAHNPAAATQLVETWREIYGNLKPHIIFGLLKDKDARSICQIMRQIGDYFSVVPVRSARSFDSAELAGILANSGAKISVLDSVRTAIEAAAAGPVLITGSLFLVGEALEILTGSPPDVYRSAQ